MTILPKTIDAHNVTNRVFRPLAEKLGCPINWHAFRRAHSTFQGELGAPVEDRVAVMGHADARMTLYYSIEDIERRRKTAEGMMQRLTGKGKGEVLHIRRKAIKE